MKPQHVTSLGSVGAGILASGCCLGPLVLSMLGLSGVAFAQRLEPLRPYFLVLTYGLLASAFWLEYRARPAACRPGGACEMPRASRIGRIGLWLAAIVVLLATTFPWYAEHLPF